MFMQPFAIIPKFLWNEIYPYLNHVSNLKLLIAHPQFTDIKTDLYYKTLFLETRSCNIAVVQLICDERAMADSKYRIKNFWLVALITYDGFDDIEACSDFICGVCSTLDQPVIFKVFIKDGEYEHDFDQYERVNHNFRLELIGSKSGSTRIISPTKYGQGYLHIFDISSPRYFSMTHIDFSDAACAIMSKCKRDHIDYEATVIISNCVFGDNTKRYSLLQMMNIYNVIITDCAFFGIETITMKFSSFYQAHHKKRMAFTFTDSVFSDCNICCKILLHKNADIIFNNNTVTKSDALIDLGNGNDSLVSIKNNRLDDTAELITGTYRPSNVIMAGNTIVKAMDAAN